MPDARSPLASSAADGAEMGAGLRCEEKKMADIVIVSAWRDTMATVFDAVAGELDIGIPDGCKAAVSSDRVTVFRMAPCQLMIVSETSALLSSLRRVVAQENGAVSQQGHSRTRFRLSGIGAAALISRGAPIDLDGDFFPADAFAQTAIHRMPVLIHRPPAAIETFDIYVPRSFALSFRRWLEISARIAGLTEKRAKSPLD